MEAQAAVFGRLIDVDATVGEVRDRVLPERRCLAPDRFGPIKIALLVFVAVALLRFCQRRWFAWTVADECDDRVSEFASVEVLDESDYVTAESTSAVKHLLADIDAETVVSAAYGASPDTLGGALRLELNISTIDFVFDWYAACAFDGRSVETDNVPAGVHAAPRRYDDVQPTQLPDRRLPGLQRDVCDEVKLALT